MGYYIQTGGAKKTQAIIDQHDAVRVTKDEARAALLEGKGVVCVIEGGMFDAAGFMFDEQEFDEFADPQDTRRKVWLVMDRELAEELSGWAFANRNRGGVL